MHCEIHLSHAGAVHREPPEIAKLAGRRNCERSGVQEVTPVPGVQERIRSRDHAGPAVAAESPSIRIGQDGYGKDPNRSISQDVKRDTGQYDASEGPWNGCRAKWVEGSRGVFIAPGGCGRASRMVG